jgi:hypothetical protein
MALRLAGPSWAEWIDRWFASTRRGERLNRNRTASMLGMDVLEARSLWAGDILAIDPQPIVVDHPEFPSSVDPLPAPQSPTIDEPIPSLSSPSAPPDPVGPSDPSQIPVEAGPGENIPNFGPATNQPNALDIVSGILAMIVQQDAADGALPAMLADPPIPPLLTDSTDSLSLPALPMRSRVGTGTASPQDESSTFVGNTSRSDVIDAILALEPSRRNDHMKELAETLSQWPTDVTAQVPGSTQWLSAIETDDDWLQLPEEPTEKQETRPTTEEDSPTILWQIAALGLAGAAWTGPRSKSSSTSETRSQRERTYVEYFGSVASADGSDGQTIAVQVRDISTEGLGILHHGPLPSRRVTIIFGDGSWSLTRRGIVRWTRRLSDNVFASGISFQQA